jgi:hypothetical protein
MPFREKTIEFHQVLKVDGTVHFHQWIAPVSAVTLPG